MRPFAGISVHLASGIPVVKTPGAIDISNADELRAALLAAAAHGYATVVADLSGTDLCDSAAFRELERAHLRARAEGGELRLVVSRARLLRVFEITGMEHVGRVYSTVAAALAGPPAMAVAPDAPGFSAGDATQHKLQTHD